jgi:hypothetical protein
MMTTATPFKTKEYSSPRWAFMKRRKIGTDGDIYLDRIYIVQTPLFGIMLHRIFRPDNQRDLHNHPWPFFSILLRGQYTEQYRDGADDQPDSEVLQHRRVRWINWKGLRSRHRIAWCSRSPIWTLVFTGRKSRTWGFFVEDGTRFIKWTEYDKVDQP